MELSFCVPALRLSPARGRDFVVGDLHGCAHLLRPALEAAGFDFERDRLICVGDLVDRGPRSELALELLAEPWFFSIRGNHEQMAIDFWLWEKENGPNELARSDAIANGMGWFVDLEEEDRERFARAFEGLPYVIEVPTERGLAGVVHAQTPPGWDWRLFVERLEQDDPVALDYALWRRDKVNASDASRVEGVGRLFCGHTPLRAPMMLGNQVYLDTGGVFRVLGVAPSEELGFTIAPMLLDAIAYEQPPGGRALMGVLEGPESIETPFSEDRIRQSAFGEVEP